MAFKNVIGGENEETDIPKWKIELINEKRTFGRTISTASGLAKLTVTCPRKMRPTIKKQISLPNHKVRKSDDFVQNGNDTDFFATVQQLQPVQNGECKNEEKESTNTITEISQGENNFPKPGLVESLKSRYMSIIEGDKYQLSRNSMSLEILNGVNSLKEKNQTAGNDKINILELQTTERLPATATVKQTKKLFEPTISSASSSSTKLLPRKQKRSLSTTNLMTIKQPINNNLEVSEERQLKLHGKPTVKPKPENLLHLSHRRISTAHKSCQTSS